VGTPGGIAGRLGLRIGERGPSANGMAVHGIQVHTRAETGVAMNRTSGTALRAPSVFLENCNALPIIHLMTTSHRTSQYTNLYAVIGGPRAIASRVAQNARGVVQGVVKGVTRASLGRRASRTPQLKRASARRREEIVFRGVYMIQQVAAVHLG